MTFLVPVSTLRASYWPGGLCMFCMRPLRMMTLVPMNTLGASHGPFVLNVSTWASVLICDMQYGSRLSRMTSLEDNNYLFPHLLWWWGNTGPIPSGTTMVPNYLDSQVAMFWGELFLIIPTKLSEVQITIQNFRRFKLQLKSFSGPCVLDK
jgi:hypothetical protein